MSVVVLITRSAEETESLGASLASLMRDGDVILLEGDLGAGKTCLVRGLAVGLGLPAESVSSPSFVIAQRYDGPSRSLVHADAYRVDGPGRLAGIDLDEMLGEPRTVGAIEWASRLGDRRPARSIECRIRSEDGDRRRLEIRDRRGDAREAARLADALRTLFGAAVEPDGPTCPICRARPSAPATTPFCSERCRLADLSRWMRGAYLISRPLEPEEEPLN